MDAPDATAEKEGARCTGGLRFMAHRSDRNAARISELKSSGCFPRGEVAALLDLVEIDQVVVAVLGPAARGAVDLARKDRHRGGDRDVDRVEVVGVVLPVELRGRGAGIREPVKSDVVEHLVTA